MALKTTVSKTATTWQRLISDLSEPETVYEYTEQNVEPLIDIAKAQSELKPDKDMRLVGHIPLVIYNQMMRDGSFNDPAAIKKWLNNPDNKCFRVAPGRG